MSIEEVFDHCRLGDQTHKRMSAQYRVVERKPTDIRLINCSAQLVEEKQKEMFFSMQIDKREAQGNVSSVHIGRRKMQENICSV